MIIQIDDLPANVAGFRAVGEITAADFKNTVMPAVQQLVDRTGKLNYLLVLDTSIRNFTFGAWFEDAIMGLKHLLKWNRAAIVTDVRGIRTFTAIFSKLMPGEFKGFTHEQLQEAIDWAAEKGE